MSETDKEKIEIQRQITETRKLIDESFKLHAERQLIDKKVHWFEFTVGVSLIALGIAFAKLFL